MINLTSQSQGTAFLCGDAFQDLRDGKIYHTVQIGSQCWMTDNMDVGERISMLKDQRDNGFLVPEVQQHRHIP